jgi:putative transposase
MKAVRPREICSRSTRRPLTQCCDQLTHLLTFVFQQRVGEVCRGLAISEQSYYRWRSEYGGLKLEQPRRMEDLEKENDRLKKAVAELTLDKQILKDALEGNF